MLELWFFLFIFLLFSIRPPSGWLPVLGPLTWYMTPTLDAALLMCGSLEGGRATSYLYEACSLSAYTPI